MGERRGVLADPGEAPFDIGRLRGFSDAVFGIAATVLVLQLEVPDAGLSDGQLHDALSDKWPVYLSFALSFAVIGRFWLVHHRLFGLIEQVDGTFLWMNHLLLMLVVFMPFASELLGLYNDFEAAQVFYSLVMLATSLVNVAMWIFATQDHRLVPSTLRAEELRLYCARAAVLPVVFGAYTLFALVHPASAALAFLLLLPLHHLVRAVFGDVSAEERRLELEAATARDIEENRAEIEFDRDAQQAPDGRSPIARLLSTTSFSNLDRLIGFSDGVYAIAITLLGFQFQPPESIDSNADLVGYLTGSYPPGDRGILPLYLSYVLSFLVIAAMWNLHHRYFLVIRAQDEAVRAINLAHLFFIVSLPFTTELMAVYGSVPAVAAIYAMNLGVAGLSLTVLWWYASQGHRLIDPSIDRDDIVWTRRLGLFMPVVFLASIALTPWIGEQVWWVWVLGLVALGLLRRRERESTLG